jgi:hypothetical protein
MLGLAAVSQTTVWGTETAAAQQGEPGTTVSWQRRDGGRRARGVVFRCSPPADVLISSEGVLRAA